MKKILIVTTKFPFPLFSGDKLRIYNIFKYLSKKNKGKPAGKSGQAQSSSRYQS